MNKKVEKRIWEVIEKYRSILLLNMHTFTLKYPTENKNATAECIFNYPYLNVTINYSDKLIEMFEEGKDIVPYIVHEMCHVITDPFYAKAESRYASKDEILDERELLTDYICNIVIINKL